MIMGINYFWIWYFHTIATKNNLVTLVENPPFLTKSFQLHDICNYVSTGFLKNLNRIMAITN
jgi:hypothetical protein